MADKKHDADKKREKEHNTTAKKDTKQQGATKKEKAKPAPQNKSKSTSQNKAKAASPNRVKSNRLKLLMTIIPRKKAEYYTDLIQSFEVNMQLVALAEGTAPASMMGFLGLLDNEKAVIFSVIQESKLSDALNTLEEKFQSIKDGKGIAFTVPLTSVIGKLIYGFLSNNKQMVKESK